MDLLKQLLIGTLTTAIVVAFSAADGAEGYSGASKAPIQICPEDTAGDVKQILGIDVHDVLSRASLITQLSNLGYEADERDYNIFLKSCSDRTLRGTKQPHVTIGWGKDKNGGEVFRSFVVLTDAKGSVRKIESRYSYR